jgi:hypothetical protein
MDEQIRYRGKTYTTKEIKEIREVLATHPEKADGSYPKRYVGDGDGLSRTVSSRIWSAGGYYCSCNPEG